jgi:hypothetical protein
MKVRTLFIVAMATISCGVFLTKSPAGRQSVALFPPQAAGVEDGARVSSLLGQTLAEKLRDRFDVRVVGQGGRSDPEERKRKARSLGTTYVLTGNVSRIGRTATLDLTLAPTENPEKGRTVFVTAEEKENPGECGPSFHIPEDGNRGVRKTETLFLRRRADRRGGYP